MVSPPPLVRALQLRIIGLEALKDVISLFATSRDVDLDENHSILEQYHAQFTAAMRPAFTPETPPDITAIAAQVVAVWISSGVNKTVSDVRRVQSLLVTPLETIESPPDAAYNERATTMSRLAVLSSWARMAIIAAEGGESMSYLRTVVQPHLPALSKHWLSALNDYALITLPPEYRGQIPVRPSCPCVSCVAVCDHRRQQLTDI